MSANETSSSLQAATGAPGPLRPLHRIPIQIDVVIGSAVLSVRDLMGLTAGDLVTLDRKLDQPVDIRANGRLVARGDLLTLEDGSGRLAVSVVSLEAGDSIPPAPQGSAA